MLVSLVAALACVIATPQSRGADASPAGAMSLPAEMEALSSPALESACWFDPQAVALVSHVDDGGSCYVMLPSHARAAMLRASRGHAGRHVAAGAIASAPEPLLPDGHAAPLLWPARLAWAPTFVIATLALPPPESPRSPPGNRIDRPPRA
jgi:hypothetical protein